MKIFEKLIKFILSYYYCLRDKNTPGREKKIIIGSLIYLLFPFDFITDLIGPLGFTDDLGVLFLALLSLRRYCTKEHRLKADRFIENYKNKKRMH